VNVKIIHAISSVFEFVVLNFLKKKKVKKKMGSVA